MDTLKTEWAQQEANANLVRELGDRLILGATNFNYPHMKSMFSRSFHFGREEPFYWFTATIIGHDEKRIFAVHIMGDCGVDTYRSGDLMTIPAFGDWLGNSNKDYILSKGTERKEFQWKEGVADLKEYLQADTGGDDEGDAAHLLKEIEESVQIRDPDLNDAGWFHKVVSELANEIDYHIDDALRECKWGRRWSAWAESRFRQLVYFGNWLKREMK